MCSILLDLLLSVICICIKCPNSFKTFLHNNFSTNLFHMKSHISCSSLQLHVNCAYYTVCCWIVMAQKYTGNGFSIPVVACSQQLLTRNKLPIGCYLFACLVFSPHDMNVFVTDLTANNVVTHMQGFSSGILMILFEKLCEI